MSTSQVVRSAIFGAIPNHQAALELLDLFGSLGAGGEFSNVIVNDLLSFTADNVDVDEDGEFAPKTHWEFFPLLEDHPTFSAFSSSTLYHETLDYVFGWGWNAGNSTPNWQINSPTLFEQFEYKYEVLDDVWWSEWQVNWGQDWNGNIRRPFGFVADWDTGLITTTIDTTDFLLSTYDSAAASITPRLGVTPDMMYLRPGEQDVTFEIRSASNQPVIQFKHNLNHVIINSQGDGFALQLNGGNNQNDLQIVNTVDSSILTISNIAARGQVYTSTGQPLFLGANQGSAYIIINSDNTYTVSHPEAFRTAIGAAAA